MRILLAEDDPMIGAAVERGLRQEGFVVDWVRDGAQAQTALATPVHDVLLLDLGLPRKEGLDVLRAMRRRNDARPVLVITARDAVSDRVAGLDAGADDYLVKPFAYEELAARLRALGRRSGNGKRRASPRLVAGPIMLDEAARSVTVDGQTVDLSPREFSLLECLLRHVGQTLSRDQLLDQAWPFNVAVTPNAVDAYVHYLRTKLGPAGSWIETVRGVGYRLRGA